MPADEQGLADCIIAWGRRQIILNISGRLQFKVKENRTTAQHELARPAENLSKRIPVQPPEK
jgi:hypothetical protein